MSFKENPYTWHEKSKLVTSSVLDVTLKNVTSGKPLHVDGLKKPVELFIKKWNRDDIIDHKLEKLEPDYFIKPSPPKSTRNMRFHKIFLPHSDVNTKIRIVPSNDKKLGIYIRNKVRPTPADYNYQTVVPNYSTCLNFTKENGLFNCLADPYIFTISPAITGYTGVHYLGIRYVKPTETSGSARVRRSCTDGRRQKRSCVEVKRPPSEPNTSEFQNGTDVQYALKVTMGTCMYWSEEKSEWTSKGCKVYYVVLSWIIAFSKFSAPTIAFLAF